MKKIFDYFKSVFALIINNLKNFDYSKLLNEPKYLFIAVALIVTLAILFFNMNFFRVIGSIIILILFIAIFIIKKS